MNNGVHTFLVSVGEIESSDVFLDVPVRSIDKVFCQRAVKLVSATTAFQANFSNDEHSWQNLPTP